MSQLMFYVSRHYWLVGFALAAAIAVLVNELRLRAGNAGGVSPQDAVRLMNQGATVLDLRPEAEFAAGHVRGARHLPMAKLAEASETFKRLKDRNIIVYCEKGSTAAGAIRKLSAQGFSKLVSLRGGIAAWRAENLPLVRD